MTVKGENSCFVCGHNIKWMAHTFEGGGYEVVTFGTRREAELIAKGKISTTQGVKVQYDAIVTCPECKVKNKFEV